MTTGFDWREFLALAETLAASKGLPQEEARQRSAVSRAYYGAYHVAREYVKQRYPRVTLSIRHGDVWQALQERATSDDEKAAGRDGDKLYGKRREADYEKLAPKNHAKESEFALALARRIRDRLANPSAPSPTAPSSPPSSPPGS